MGSLVAVSCFHLFRKKMSEFGADCQSIRVKDEGNSHACSSFLAASRSYHRDRSELGDWTHEKHSNLLAQQDDGVHWVHLHEPGTARPSSGWTAWRTRFLPASGPAVLLGLLAEPGRLVAGAREEMVGSK